MIDLGIKDMDDLKLDIDAGKKIVRRWYSVPEFNKLMEPLYGAYFMHHLHSHMHLDIPDEIMTKAVSMEALAPYINQHPLVYEDVKNIINRQFLLFACVFGSAKINANDDHEKDVLRCHAFNLFVCIPAIAAVLGDDIVTGNDTNKINSTVDAVIMAHTLAEQTDNVMEMMNEFMTKFIAFAIKQNYG